VPDVDVIDSTWIAVAPAVVGAALAEPTRWRRWWPDLELQASELRGPKGVRWAVRSADRGRLSGTMEIWLEPVAEGVVAHYFLRLNFLHADLRQRSAPGQQPDQRAVEALVHHYRTQAKRALWSVSDELDPGRLGRVRGPRR
jgi:hypothetical protein